MQSHSTAADQHRTPGNKGIHHHGVRADWRPSQYDLTLTPFLNRVRGHNHALSANFCPTRANSKPTPDPGTERGHNHVVSADFDYSRQDITLTPESSSTRRLSPCSRRPRYSTT